MRTERVARNISWLTGDGAVIWVETQIRKASNMSMRANSFGRIQYNIGFKNTIRAGVNTLGDVRHRPQKMAFAALRWKDVPK